ncbi:hypothetical protein ACB098_08G121000 [Castanea mollissima]
MGSISWGCCVVLLYLALFLKPFPILVKALPGSYWSANASTSVTNSFPTPDSVKFDDGSFVSIILSSESNGYFYEQACHGGFFCNQTCDGSLFAIVRIPLKGGDISKSEGPTVVWAANPTNPVSVNASLKLTSERGLVLTDANGTTVWSTNTSSKSVAGLNLTDNCNLMLLGHNNATIIWQSFDHPTDTLMLEQKLMAGQQLISKGGLYSLALTSEGLSAYINSNPPQRYFSGYHNFDYAGDTVKANSSYVQLNSENLTLFSQGLILVLTSPSDFSLEYMRFEPDGHLRAYGEANYAYDFLTRRIGDCDYPTVCGNYGICTNNAQCSCPPPIKGTSYFRQTNDKLPNNGCSLITPLSCKDSKYHINPNHQRINLETCKQACLKDCSCKAVFYNSNNHMGNCYLQSQIFSLMSTDAGQKNYLRVYIKVQKVIPRQKKHWLEIILVSSFPFVVFLLIVFLVFQLWKKKSSDGAEEYYLDQVPGMPTRYSYHDLQAATKEFSMELGVGGFGTVFEGTLVDDTKVAVKRFDEVETIGSIHHFNLVRLVGFCAEKSHGLLVYEYMSNGSLDKWIFHRNPEMLLDWQHRRKITIDIAKGLTYLHDDCRHKIVHLDIKPQNILLDENFNAKVLDFGLSKLVDREQSQIVTTMRGTPGYMALEWLSSVITEKVGVYNFGVVLLEILCGRRNFDRSQPEEAMHLLAIFKKKIEEDQLLDLVDKYNEDMSLHGEEVVNIMQVVAWCLQNDFTKRPSMSIVVKVLEGVVNVESNQDDFFLNPPLPNTRAGVHNQEMHVATATQLLPSIRSGPR